MSWRLFAQASPPDLMIVDRLYTCPSASTSGFVDSMRRGTCEQTCLQITHLHENPCSPAFHSYSYEFNTQSLCSKQILLLSRLKCWADHYSCYCPKLPWSLCFQHFKLLKSDQSKVSHSADLIGEAHLVLSVCSMKVLRNEVGIAKVTAFARLVCRHDHFTVSHLVLKGAFGLVNQELLPQYSNPLCKSMLSPCRTRQEGRRSKGPTLANTCEKRPDAC